MIELFDAQTGFGGGQRGNPWVPSLGELQDSMRRLDVGRALVRTEFDDMDSDPMEANRLLYEECARGQGLVPCPVLMPEGHGDVPSEREQVDDLVRRGAAAAWLRPGPDGWSLAEWCAGKLLRELERRRVPVLCRHSVVGFDDVADLAGRYPRLPIVIYQLGYRTQRLLVSLLKAFPNVHLSAGSPWSVHLGLELVAGQVGPERLLFGTGWPYAEPMASITMLTYSGLSEADKRLVGSGNLDRLIGGIRR
jgi:predicted TIM-barrel fold metal-dependent hydrolase